MFDSEVAVTPNQLEAIDMRSTKGDQFSQFAHQQALLKQQACIRPLRGARLLRMLYASAVARRESKLRRV